MDGALRLSILLTKLVKCVSVASIFLELKMKRNFEMNSFLFAFRRWKSGNLVTKSTIT